MDRFTKFALRNAAAIVILVTLVIAGGIYSATRLSRESMPDISIPVITVVSVYPGASPEDIYTNITKPMETALRGVEGVDKLDASSADSVSLVVAQFSYSEDMEKAKKKIEEAAATVKMPDGAQAPKVSRISFGSSPILKLSVSNDATATSVLEQSVKDNVVPVLQGIAGVGEARVSSESEKSVHITFSPDKLKKYGLTADGVIQQLQAANLSFPLGSVQMGNLDKPVRVSGNMDSLRAIKNLKVAVYPDQNKIMGDAFAQIGKGMGQLGSAVGQIGGAVGQLGGAVGQLGSAVGQLGQGMGAMGQTLGTQIGLVAAVQSLQGQVLDAKIALSDAKIVLADPNATPAQKAAAQGTVARMSGMIPALEGALKGVEAKLAAAQKAAMASAGSPSGSSSGPSSLRSESARRSSGSLSTASTTTKKSNTTIKLVPLSKVATITYDAGKATTVSRTNGKPSVLIDIIKTQGSNTVDVSKEVRAQLAATTPKLPKGSKIDYVYDASVGINASVDGMLREGLLGALFATLVVLLFLRNFRATIISIVSIPLSLLIAVLCLGQIAGATLNIMTLAGLTVAIGRVVDDSIVVIENIWRHLQRGEERTPELIRLAVHEVAKAITSSTLTTVAVFVPLGLVSGVIGKIFFPFAVTVALALLGSLLVALTVVPLMAKWTLFGAKVPEHKHEDSRTTKMYRSSLTWALDHRFAVLGIALVMLLGTVALVPLIGTGFIPQTKEKYLNVSVKYPQGTVVAVVDKKVQEVEKVLSAEKDVLIYQTTAGAASGQVDMSGSRASNVGTMFVKLGPDANTATLPAQLKKRLASLEDTTGVTITVTRHDVSGTSGSLEVYVMGDDKAAIAAGNAKVLELLRKTDGLENVTSNLSESAPEIAIDVKQALATKQGMSAAQVAGTVRSLLAEQTAGTVSIGSDKKNILYSLKLDPVRKLDDLRTIDLRTPMGKTIELKSIANVSQKQGPVAIYTRDQKEYAAVSADFTTNDTGPVISAVKAALATMDLPKGVTTLVAGTAEQMSQSFSQLGMAMVIAVGAVYLVMIVAFGEAVAPLAILFSLPLAIIGGLIGLLLTGLPIDMPAMIGALMLIGIVVTNAIVLVDRVQSKRGEGLPLREALLEAGSTRMRPILMTAIATIGALAPLGSGMAEGALLSQSLAVVVIGGLTTSTMLTLIVVPVAYDVLENAKDRILGRRKDAKVAKTEPEAA